MSRKFSALDLEIQRVDLLYRQNVTGLIAVGACASAFAWIAWPIEAHAFIAAWWGILNLSVLLRVLATLRWKKINSSLSSFSEVNRWHFLMKALLFISGVGWGTIGWISVGSNSPMEQLSAGLILMGMSAGALATYAPSQGVMFAVLLPATIPWSIRMLLSDNPEMIALGLLCAMFAALMVKIGRNLNNYVNKSLLLNAKLHESEEHLRMARDSSDAISWQWEVSSDTFSCEGNVQKLLGDQAPQESGQLIDFINCIHADDQSVLKSQIDEGIAGGVLDIEVRSASRDINPRWIAVRGKAHYGDSGLVEGIAGICWDITDKKSQEHLRRERDVFAAANRAKSIFLANVSHEIRTPLAAINGFAACALDRQHLPPEVSDELEIILRNGKFLISMVNDLLDFSKSETDPLYIQTASIQPMREIDDAVQMIQPAIDRKGLQLEVQYDSLIPEAIESDPARFRQILNNLLDNAVKYTDKGKVTVRVSCDRNLGRGLLRVVVADTGVGMGQTTQSNLFQPFVRGQASDVQRIPGSGLGLALSQSLARRLGGDVKILHSILESGSAFELTVETGPLNDIRFLPGAYLRGLSAELVKPSIARRSLSGKKLLLVEDDPDLSWLMQKILQREGATLQMAANGEEAVARAMRDPFHVILMDIKMPVMDGYKATSILRERGYRNSIVALTASAGAVDKQLCFQAGCDAYLSKPVDAAHLLDVIGKQLGPLS